LTGYFFPFPVTVSVDLPAGHEISVVLTARAVKIHHIQETVKSRFVLSAAAVAGAVIHPGSGLEDSSIRYAVRVTPFNIIGIGITTTAPTGIDRRFYGSDLRYDQSRDGG